MRKYTDEQYLYTSFTLLLHKQNDLLSNLTGDLTYMVRDGFNEKIDEDQLSEFMLSLADRCGYVLVDGMWCDKKELEAKRLQENQSSLMDILDGQS